MEEQGDTVFLPDCRAAFLFAYFLEIGPSISAGFGPAPVGWQDVEAWQRLTGIELPAWQARAVVQMSRAFVGFLSEAEDPSCPEPWADEAAVADRRARVEAALRQAFRERREMAKAVPQPGPIRKRPKTKGS